MNIVSLIRKAVGDAVSDNIGGAIIKKNSLARPVPVCSHVRAYMLVCAVDRSDWVDGERGLDTFPLRPGASRSQS